MATSSILGGTPAPAQADGRGTDALGPSDSSDSGSDVMGERPMATGPDDPDNWGAVPSNPGSDSDRFGTGERASATPGGRNDRVDGDISPDRIAEADAVMGEIDKRLRLGSHTYRRMNDSYRRDARKAYDAAFATA